MTEQTVQEQLDALKKQNEKLKAIVENKNFNPVQQTLGNLVESTLGKRFEWRVLGFGQFQTLELEVPEDLADPVAFKGELRFYKTHPKAGQPCGDVRHCRIKDEEQIRQWLAMVKNEIIKRKTAEGQAVEF